MYQLEKRRGAPGLLAMFAGLLALGSTQSADAAFVTPTASEGLTYEVVDNGVVAPSLADTFIDTTAGTSNVFTSDDTFVSLTAPFAVSIGQDAASTAIRVHDNGYLTVGGAANSQPSNAAFPIDSFAGSGAIAPFWDDLFPKDTSAVRSFAPDADTFVVEWVDMAHFDDQTASYNFQVVFFANKPGEILIQYGTMTDGTGAFADGSSATSGIQNAARDGFVVLTDRTGDIAPDVSIGFDFDDDRDGLPASVEDLNRDGVLDAGESDPAIFDTDAGGTGDGGELVNLGTDPQDGADDVATDGDLDNISDADEPVIGTDPTLADTDGDGLNDDVEFFDNGTGFITDPNRKDSDGDLLSDFDEVNVDGDPASFAIGLDADPNNPDTDGGGENDGAEVIGGRDVNVAGDDSLFVGVTRTALATGNTNDRSTMHAAIDDAGNVHATFTSRNNVVRYGMTDPAGTVLIGATTFGAIGRATFAHVFTLPSGRVAIVSASGGANNNNGGNGGIHYRLIDPALDPQVGAAANPALNPNTPPTVGAGVTLIERTAVENVSSLGPYRHLSASFDGANIHLTFQSGNPRQVNTIVYYAKIKAESGALVSPVVEVIQIDKPNDSANSERLPTHRKRNDRIFGDAQGRAHILFQGKSRRPSRGGFKQDVMYARIGADGSIERPLSVVGTADSHGTLGGIAITGNTVFLTHSSNPGGSARVRQGARADVALTRLDQGGLFAISNRILDGPSIDSIGRNYQDIYSNVTGTGNVISAYMDVNNGSNFKFTAVGPDGRTIVEPVELDTNIGFNRQPKQHATAVAVSPDGSRAAVAWFRRNSARIDFASVDLSNPAIGALAISNITVVAGGTLDAAPGSDFENTQFVFDANDVTADTFGLIRANSVAVALSGIVVGTPVGVELQTGGATLEAAATFDVTLPVDDSFTGNPAELEVVQIEGTTVTPLVTTFDAATGTVSATGTAIGVFAVVHNPAVAFAITSTPPTVAAINTPYSYAVVATSSTPTSFTLLEAPVGMTIDNTTGEINWTPEVGQIGQFNVEVLATNGFDSITQSYTIAVSIIANTNPVFVSAPSFRGEVGVEYTYTPEVVDPDSGQSFTYSLFTAPSGMTVDGATGTVTWTPTEDQTGSNAVSIVVSDGFGTSSQIFAVDVLGDDEGGEEPDNIAPQFTSSPPLQVKAGDDFEYTASALDVDGDDLTFTLLSGPDGMAIDAATGAVTWSTDFDDVGSNPVALEVSDGTVSATQLFAVEVVRTAGDDGGGCGCRTTDTGAGSTGIAMMLMALVFGFRRRRRN